jgi:uncharacterized protein (TIGR02680 family)
MSEEVLQESRKQGRWQMNRAGILNFWFYEDEEFTLEDGRLVLRGTNGAGKSVTMQSFVPLVLDGDKRPHRLDPFGSKDRRIEYYLLGEKDEHSDRTGYLWLEFVHTTKNIYKTIGIGLKARRGVPQVGFWGFVLEDGRRVNQDFWLYDRVLELEGQGKFPLDRKALEERIGAGGQVVQEQRAYRDMVNRVLFGFYDKEAYTDLLQLLVQLRSPKLSKDVKPTAIYEILVQSLPPLHDEELRPLSEVMEDMDQLADRLDELKLHQSELEKLNRSYEQYNRYFMYQNGQQLLDANQACMESQRQLSGLSKQLQSALAEEAEVEAKQEMNREQLMATETELELLGRSEAMEKQQELEATELALKETEQFAEQAQKRLTSALRSQEAAELAGEKAEKLKEELLVQQQEGLDELESIAGDMEFEHHGIYARYWSAAPPEDTVFFSSWRKDLETHRSSIMEAIKFAEQERAAELIVAEYDKQLGAMRSERDQAERLMRAAEGTAEEALHRWKERVLEWKQNLRELQLREQAVQKMFAASGELSFEQQSLEVVLRPVNNEAELRKQELIVAKLEQEQEVKLRKAKLEELEAEKRAWQHSREPEPVRSAERALTRSGYGAGQGAPLFEACEFHPRTSTQEQASIEQALLNSGLLDAWIRPDGKIGKINDRDEDVWIVVQPLEWGYTLADVLKPAPSSESGLTEQMVEAALRSFAWGEAFDSSNVGESNQSVVIGSNYYQYGSIVGKVDAADYKAQFVGKEARKQFKLAEIERLNREIALHEKQVVELTAVIERLEASVTSIIEDVASFPMNDEWHASLRSAWNAQYETTARFRLLMEQEGKVASVLRVKQEHWAQVKQALLAATNNWTRLKNLRDLQEALEGAASYLGELSQLQSDWREYRQALAELQRYMAEATIQGELAETEEEQRNHLFDKQYTLRIKAEQLRKLMVELGISDLHARISNLRAKRKEITLEQEQLTRASKKLASDVAVWKERQSVLAEQERELADKLNKRMQTFRDELALQLIPEVQGAEGSGMSVAGETDRDFLHISKHLVSTLEPSMSRANKERLSGVLQDQFNASKHLLGEYVLEAEISEQGRISILSLRDRTRPQRPAVLLSEMVEIIIEQENLLSEKDRELFEEIILRSVGKSIRQRIQRAEQWMKTMNRLMSERDTSSGLKLQLQWLPKAAQSEQELNSDELVALLRRDAHLLHDDEVERLVGHFRSRIQWAKQGAAEERETLRKHIYDMLDYRSWFQFSLRYKKGEEAQYRELTDSRFNVLSGGEKAMSMYIPLFAATYSRYADASPDAPKIISLDEAFAGVDDENIRDLFGLLSEMDFDYMMTSQMLWGCYDTVPKLGICEIYRPKDAEYVTLFRYRWNGKTLEHLVEDGGLESE